MNTYTIFAYVVPDGGHHVEAVTGNNATDAVVALREKLGLERNEFEVVAVARGTVTFEPVDERKVALSVYSANSP